MVKKIELKQPDYERFISYIDFGGGKDDCWIWKGQQQNGRGVFTTYDKRTPKILTAHILSYTLIGGFDTPARTFISKCGNRLCVNPSHIQPRDFQNRFWDNVTKPNGNDGCWEWDGDLDGGNGYGRITIDKKVCLVHRVAFEKYYDTTIPDDLMVCHKCNNRKCINPSHLYVGTHNDNMRDMANSNVMKGEKNPKALLNVEQVREIKQHIKDRRIVYRKLAEMYGVSRQAIKDIASGRTWNWVE